MARQEESEWISRMQMEKKSNRWTKCLWQELIETRQWSVMGLWQSTSCLRDFFTLTAILSHWHEPYAKWALGSSRYSGHCRVYWENTVPSIILCTYHGHFAAQLSLPLPIIPLCLSCSLPVGPAQHKICQSLSITPMLKQACRIMSIWVTIVPDFMPLLNCAYQYFNYVYRMHVYRCFSNSILLLSGGLAVWIRACVTWKIGNVNAVICKCLFVFIA